MTAETALQSQPKDKRSQECVDKRHENGWALIGLLLALGVMSIFITSAIVPNVQKEVQRDKEAEMLYRGQQMAEGIARYYGRGQLRGIIITPTPIQSWPYLTDLAKLRDGVSLGVRELKFVRPSAMIDPIANSEWEPIRMRDPRLMTFLQNWIAFTLVNPPPAYFDYAGPHIKTIFKPSDPSSSSQTPGSGTQGSPNSTNPTNPGSSQAPGRPPTDPNDPNDPDDDDDPFADMFSDNQPGKNTAPIIGVISKKKGQAINTYFGLTRYEEWIFIYIPIVATPPGGRVSP